ncbi:MAG: hypothetical protein R3E50_08160 [Halioglobus sp.]
MIRRWLLVFSLLYLWVSLPSPAASIDPGNPAAVLDSLGLPTDDIRYVTAPLFNFSPFSADSHTVVPGFADPLGTGIDPALRVFSGKVQFMDLLGNFRSKKSGDVADVELPPDALKGIDLLKKFYCRVPRLQR